MAFHFFNEEATRYAIYDGIRQTYNGPLSIATDMMVWNITRDAIKERMAVSADDAWDTARPTMPPPPDKTVAGQKVKISSTPKTCDMSDFEISKYCLMEFRFGSIWYENLNRGI